MSALLIIPFAIMLALASGTQEAYAINQRIRTGNLQELPHASLALLRIVLFLIAAVAIILFCRLHVLHLVPMALLTYGSFAPLHRVVLNTLRQKPWWHMGPKLHRPTLGRSRYDECFHRMAQALDGPAPYYSSELPAQIAYGVEVLVFLVTLILILFR